MSLSLRPYEPGDFARVLEICVAAFTPIHEGFRAALGPEIFDREYSGWRERYATDIQQLTGAPGTMLHVVEDGGAIVGFITTVANAAKKLGEIGLNAVDPAAQGRGIGRFMYRFALQSLKERGAEVATVGTGADAAHAPARAAYEAVGFDRSISSIYYFMKL